MPPKGKPKPSEAELDTIYAWIDADVLKVDCNPNGPKDPGRVTIRRLNRAEYDNTIRDLVGVSVPRLPTTSPPTTSATASTTSATCCPCRPSSRKNTSPPPKR